MDEERTLWSLPAHGQTTNVHIRRHGIKQRNV